VVGRQVGPSPGTNRSRFPSGVARVTATAAAGAIIQMRTSLAKIMSVFRAGVRDLAAPASGNVPGLDLLRSLAILLVVAGHYYGVFATARDEPLAIGRFPIIYFGWTGVDLFFVLSGYLIGRQLWRELVRRNTIDVPVFLLRRGLRIWPFYFAFVAWTYLRTSRHASAFLPHTLAFLPDTFFLSNYLPGSISGGWSLSTEEQFYIFVPLLLLSVNALIRVRHQFLVLIGLLIALPLIRLWTLHGYPPGISQDEVRRLIQLPFHTHADGLLAGVLISWLSVVHPRFLASLPLARNLRAPIALAVAGLVLRGIYPRIFSFSGLALIFAGLALFVLRDRSVFTRFASRRAFYVTSRLSYGMYLNHFQVLPLCVPLFAKTSLNAYLGFFVGFPIALLSSMTVAAITFLAIESPFLQLRDRWLMKRRARIPAVHSDPSVAR
jgi:peptidoglycan/LPS O-acetylase OafA/YrhL